MGKIFNTFQMGRTVFIDTDVIGSQLDSLPNNRFSFGFLCGQCTRSERDYIHYIIDGLTSNHTDINAFLDASTNNRELWAKIIEITSSLCAGVSVVGFYCRAKPEVFKSTNFTLKIRRLFEILQSALRTYSPWSLSQSSHRILLQSELGGSASKWLVKTMDMASDSVHFRPVEMKTYESKTHPNWCMTTMIPVQFQLWFSPLDLQKDENIKSLENQFEEQWKEYVEQLKESLLLMNDRMVPIGPLKLPSQSSENSVDIQWLPPIGGPRSSSSTEENRLCYQFDGSTSLRLFTCHAETTGNDLRQYFVEDLFRSMLIRLNLALINNENGNGETTLLEKITLPRRFYVNRPVFISAYQLAGEPLSTVVDSLQENFKITSILEEDLEAGEEFPPELTNDERVKQFNSNINTTDDNQKTQRRPVKRNLYQNIQLWIENTLGTGNAVLIVLLTSIVALLLAIMIKLFS